MKEETKTDGFQSGVADKSEECAWCGKVIHQYVSCYYGGQRVGNVIICKKCGDKASALENDSINFSKYILLTDERIKERKII